jgi:peptidoglycan L-alanyl-D-glutamate endopeptidase CwlK
MSQTLLKQDVLFYQRLLKCNGFYPYKLDGQWGPKTDAADQEFSRQSQAIAAELGSFDARSESNILTLTPKAQRAARKFLNACHGAGKDVRILSGTRTYAEQDALYRKGRYGNPEPKVTNAKGGRSNHNFGIAWDIGLFENGKYITTDKQYKQLAQLMLPQLPELEWGGNWRSFPDVPHYQLRANCGDDIAQVRTLFESGTAYV